MNVVFSFDDGRSDAYLAHSILKKYNLVGSFHITTGFIDGTFQTKVFGDNRTPLSVTQINEMSRNGMDISSHGDRHIMETTDFRVSLNKLKSFGLNFSKIGFSIPNSRSDSKTIMNFIEDNKFYLSYIRVGRSEKCYLFISKIRYFLYHILHFQTFFNHFNKHNVFESVDRFKINSLVVLKDSKSKNIMRFIKNYKDTNKTLVLMFHSIVEKPKDKWEYSIKEFEDICKYVSQNACSRTLAQICNN